MSGDKLYRMFKAAEKKTLVTFGPNGEMYLPGEKKPKPAPKTKGAQKPVPDPSQGQQEHTKPDPDQQARNILWGRHVH